MAIKILLFPIILLSFLIFPQIIWADSWCPATWSEYKCEGAECAGNILTRECWEYCCESHQECEEVCDTVYDEMTGESTQSCGENCWDVCDSCCTECGSPSIYAVCENWQTCQGGNSWSTEIPQCKCTGKCLETPKNDRYYNNPEYSDQSNKNIGNKNIFLPVKLDWDDVEGWNQGEESPQSYAIRITTSTGSFSKTLSESEYIPRACLLPSNKTSYWGVKACCGADGKTNCGSESNWNLTANSAPEPVSPYDPDWIGEKKAENTSLPVTLDWCSVEEAQSYRFNVYIIAGGKKICHPDLLATMGGEEVCDSWLLRKTRRDPEQIERILYSDFFDENMDFFTKNTAYAWQATICDENGFDCQKNSQLWMFSTQEVPLTASFLVSPTNDPTGKTPVGLPLALDWNDKPGVNSFIYEVAPVSGGEPISGSTNVSQSKSLNFPLLSLNAFYKWKVKSCWDYEAEKCEPEFSEEWYFKTTGQAPNLTYPASGEQNVVIPVNLKWEKVPGAESYIFKISGNGLNLEKTLDEPEFSLDFPEYPISQETNYSWQVKTCAWDKDKGACGQYSDAQSFRTFRLPPPQKDFLPKNNGQFFTDEKYVSWEKVPGAKAYQYQIKYLALAAEEKDEDCPALTGKDMFEQPQKTLANSDFVELKCLGEYQWQVRSCLDNNCLETSNWSNSLSFTFLEGGTGQNGLIPCGQSTDNLKTPWNERDPCQIKHLFLSVKIIVDFLLFKIAPIILVLLTINTGLIFYTSLGQIMTMGRVISLWKAAGIGLAIIFLAWTIVNIFLKLVGYNIGVFGNWYELPM